jgi:hypothetical protein
MQCVTNLERLDFVPVLFDFEKPKARNYTETVTLLARMARFIIADLTSPRSLPQELQAIVPDLDNVPVQPVIRSSDQDYGMTPSKPRAVAKGRMSSTCLWELSQNSLTDGGFSSHDE